MESDAVLRAIGNPRRLRILSLVAGRDMSAAQLARELGVNHASASYHLRRLEAAGLVEVAETRRNRGATERCYRQWQRAGPEGERASQPESWRALLSAICVELQRRGQETAAAPKWVFDGELWVSPDALGAARAAVGEALDGLQAAAGEPSTERSARVSATALLFELTAHERTGAE